MLSISSTRYAKYILEEIIVDKFTELKNSMSEEEFNKCDVDLYIPSKYAPIYDGDWMDSLIERPNKGTTNE